MTARVELLRGPGPSDDMSPHALDVADDIAETAALRAQHAKAPARLGHQVDEVGQVGLGGADRPFFRSLWRWPRFAGPASAPGAAVGGACALDQAVDELAVAHHVELEPERLAGVGRHVLDRADAHRRERERHAELSAARAARISPSACCMPVSPWAPATGMRPVGRPWWWRRAVFHVDGHALAQLDRLEIALLAR